MFDKVQITHYRLVLLFGGFFYPTWKLLHLLGFHTPEPFWARIPALLMGIIFLFLSFGKRKNDILYISKLALILALYSTAEYFYLIAHQYFISPQAFTIYVIGGFVVIGCYTMCWKHLSHLITYSTFSILTFFITFGFLYFSENGLVQPSILISYITLFCLQFIVLFWLNYTFIKQTDNALSKIKNDELALVNSQKINQVSEMAGGIAHEMNNPFMAMQLSLEKIELKFGSIKKKLGNLSDEENKKISMEPEILSMQKSMERITNTIDTLLIFSRNKSVSEDGKKEYNLTKIVENAVNLCSSKFFNSHINIKNQMLDLDIFSKCNQTDIFQVVYNLITNACEAIERDTTLINREVVIKSMIDSEKSTVSFIFEDSAKNISDENMSKLFIPFFTTKELSKNFGTGLSISKGIIEDHGGKILYKNNPKSFTIVLKYQKVSVKGQESKVS